MVCPALFFYSKMTFNKNIILASASPRRQLLLKQIGIKFEAIESGINEDLPDGMSPVEHVLTLSAAKAEKVSQGITDGFVIGADTIVVADGRILGKPRDPAEAAGMLRLLSARTHEVYTGFAIVDKPTGKIFSDYERTEVTFRELLNFEIEQYVKTGSPLDKAGAYGIQDDYGAVFISRINGCFYNVVGFPLTKFYLAINNFQKELALL